MVIKKSINGTPSVTLPFLCTVGESFDVGDIVLAASGKAKVSTASAGLAANTVLGVAASKVTVAVSTDVLQVEVNPDLIFRATYEGANPTAFVAYGRGVNADEFDGDITANGYILVMGNIDTTNKEADVMIGNRISLPRYDADTVYSG